MSSQRMIRRENKRVRLQRLSEKRSELRKQLNDPALDIEEKFEIIAKIEKMPRDSSYVRLSRRCRVTGRGRGVYRKFGLCRNELRRRAMSGEVPGLVKSSW
ncbi:30S ribosomal protein S14 [Candidatus Berkiella aquae]|uniref:Small ribosomal subunit protein uS14 n=1 Tax=Candidatus Berkiella aquae TaxID=295108 RepID=A0A0Q9YBG6_9GAMM|nr:30S ribosomal protein S14 [Candidatus Berkiella aquae]MCS5710277.1 30S ribosomal protein S14 [Candidatus Berkiella aquae]